MGVRGASLLDKSSADSLGGFWRAGRDVSTAPELRYACSGFAQHDSGGDRFPTGDLPQGLKPEFIFGCLTQGPRTCSTPNPAPLKATAHSNSDSMQLW